METKNPPIIGEFESVPNNRPRKVEPLLTPSPVAPPSAPTEKQSAEGTVTASDVAKVAGALEEALRPLTPEEKAKRYLEGLAMVGVTQEEARSILDSVLFNEYYEETVTIGRGVTAVIRTRTYNDTQRMLRILEAEAPKMPVHYNDILARCNVAASLVEYNQKKFTAPVRSDGMSRDAFKKLEEEAFHDKVEYVLQLPTPVMSKLMNMVALFDSKILAVFDEGAPEDF